jgi:hypothetical protein
MLWDFTILKMCVYKEYHLVLIFKDYLVSMWYIILMTNSNSIMSINHLVGFYLPLVAKVQISRFGDSVGSTPETPVVQPRRLRWFNPGDSGPPRNFRALLRLTLTTYLKICLSHYGGVLCFVHIRKP